MKKVGVDLGGRWLRIGVIDPINNGAIPQPDTPRNGPQSWNEFVDIILSIAHNDVEGYGIAVAGPVENHSTVIRGPNLPWLNGRNVRQELELVLGGRVVVSNDMEAAAEGEMARGILQHYKWAIFDTISTGWGGCLILDGQRIDGEPGHMNVSSDPRYVCGCGRIGCYEVHYSGSAMKKRILHELRDQNIAFAFDSNVSDSQVWEHFHQELDADASWAVSLLDDWAEGVGKAWANVLNRIRPLQAIVYMGTTAEKLIPKAEERLRDPSMSG
jgi:glucokinase